MPMVSFKNSGIAERILFDIHNRPRAIKPGQTLPIDLPEKALDRLKIAARTDKTFSIVSGDDEGEERNQRHTLDEGEGVEEQKRKLHPASEPKSLNELTGGTGMQKRHHDHDDEPERDLTKQHDDLPLEGIEGADGVESATGSAPQSDPVKANAVRPAPADTTRRAMPGAPKSIADLVNRAGNFSEDEIVRYANELLPPNTLGKSPKPSEILHALKKAMAEEGKATTQQAPAKKKDKKTERVRVNK